MINEIDHHFQLFQYSNSYAWIYFVVHNFRNQFYVSSNKIKTWEEMHKYWGII